MHGTKSSNEINDAFWLRYKTKKTNGIPADCVPLYWKALNYYSQQYKKLIEDIHNRNGNAIKIPVSLDNLENYFEGFRFILGNP